MGWAMFLLALVGLVILMLLRKRDAARAAQSARDADSRHRSAEAALLATNQALTTENVGLQAFRDVRDASVEASRLRGEASAALAAAEQESASIRENARMDAQAVLQEADRESEELKRSARQGNAEARQKAEAIVNDANQRAARLVSDAETRANEIAGDAYRALRDAQQSESTAIAMRNVIDGYGDRYLKPVYSLLDELADDFGFEEAGRELKLARANSRSMIESDRAATCDYVEKNRRETAVRFVLDAFNGKVDTILARVKSDNAGTLEQQIHDAFSLVNHNGNAFRAARIAPEFRDSRLAELKWAAAATALKEREREEQRRIREQIREEERARREIERAVRDAAKEEDTLQRAVARAQAQVAKANEEQRVQFETQLAELKSRLAEAEVRNQRALSMAQQTKAGHVYVISNVGSFGEQVFKIGMTRRLEPMDRVRELSDASVPFPFDVHAMIWTDDAPALENVLHKNFLTAQVNKVNPRKEFFRVPLADLKNVVESTGVKALWTLTAEAAQYRETRAIEEDLAQRNSDAQRWLQMQMEVPPEELVAEES